MDKYSNPKINVFFFTLLLNKFLWFFFKNKNLAFQKISLKLHFSDIFKALYWLISCKIKPNYIIWLGDVNCVHSKWRSFDVANLSSRFQRFARIFFFILYIIPTVILYLAYTTLTISHIYQSWFFREKRSTQNFKMFLLAKNCNIR